MSEEELRDLRDMLARVETDHSKLLLGLIAAKTPKLLAEIDRLRTENEELRQLGADE